MRKSCRCCGGGELAEVFDLGVQPFANGFLTPEQLDKPEPRSPLVLMECVACGMVQLRHVTPAVDLFAEYAFQTGSSTRMVRHFRSLLLESIGRYVPRGKLVVEIGSNDGAALASIPDDRRCRRLGIDPAANLTEIARRSGVPTVTAFFTEELAGQVATIHGEASLIVACNVVAHIDDLDDFCRGVRRLLKHDGAFVMEVPDVDTLLARTAFDTIYHEHLSYFSVGPLATLFARHGLRVEAVEWNEVHGGSLRLTVRHGTGHSGDVSRWRDWRGIVRDWNGFAARCERERDELCEWLDDARADGGTVVGYGAPAKATVRLNYCGIGTDRLACVVDSTPSKQGRLMPGTHQPIYGPEWIDRSKPSDVLVLAWNHEREIVGKLAGYGGRVASVVRPRRGLRKLDM